MLKFIRDYTPAVIGSVTGAVISAAAPLPDDAGFFNREIPDDQMTASTISKHVLSALAGGLTSHVLSHSTLGEGDYPDSGKKWFTKQGFYTVCSSLVTGALGVYTAGAAFDLIHPFDNEIANTVTASLGAAATIVTFAYLGSKSRPRLAADHKPQDLYGAPINSSTMLGSEMFQDTLGWSKIGALSPAPEPSIWPTLLLRSGIFILGATAGVTVSTAVPLAKDLSWFTVDFTDNQANTALIVKHLGSAAAGGVLLLLAFYSDLGKVEDRAEAPKPWLLLTGHAMNTLLLTSAGLIVSGEAFPRVHLSSSNIANEAIGGAMGALTTGAFAFAGAKPLINYFRSPTTASLPDTYESKTENAFVLGIQQPQPGNPFKTGYAALADNDVEANNS